jgi:hypothetical protein
MQIGVSLIEADLGEISKTMGRKTHPLGGSAPLNPMG